MILTKTQVEHAVDLQERSYQLLLWLDGALEKGVIQPEAATSFTTTGESALKWMEQHYLNLPNAARPAKEDLPAFSRLFTTYLTNTFDLGSGASVYQPPPDAHRYHPMTNWMVRARRLQPKKPTSADRKRARNMMRARICEIGVACGASTEDEEVELVLRDASLRETVGLCTYAQDLLNRLNGVSVGPASLLLWRSFAWTPQGSPKKSFSLSSTMILEAQELLVQRLTNGPQSSSC